MLEFHNVSVAVQHTSLLSNISVSFPKGQITTVVGPNGCGKTTLLQVLNGSSKVTSGEIYLDDIDYLSLSLQERATKCSAGMTGLITYSITSFLICSKVTSSACWVEITIVCILLTVLLSSANSTVT